MTRLVPVGFLTFREAAVKIEDAMFAGVPDRAVVVKARQQSGSDVGDREANREAIGELWKAVDAGSVRAVAIGGIPRHVIELNPDLTRAIPTLRRTGDFTSLRPRNLNYADIAGWFGVSQISHIVVAFARRDVEKLCSRLRGARRRKAGSSATRRGRGRPAVHTLIRPCVLELMDRGKWNTSQSMKALTQLVSRKLMRNVSEDSVSRVLDGLHTETDERRFLRHRRSRQH